MAFVIIGNSDFAITCVGNRTSDVQFEETLKKIARHQRAIALVREQHGYWKEFFETKIFLVDDVADCLAFVENILYKHNNDSNIGHRNKFLKHIAETVKNGKRCMKEGDDDRIEEGKAIRNPPAELSVRKGARVRLKYQLESKTPHDIEYTWYRYVEPDDDVLECATGPTLFTHLETETFYCQAVSSDRSICSSTGDTRVSISAKPHFCDTDRSLENLRQLLWRNSWNLPV